MSPAIIELLVLAGIAIFLIMRLRNVLGTREGFEKPAVQEALKAERPSFKVIEGGEDADILDNAEKGSATAEALALMKQRDSNFTVNDFLAGSKYAYEMILMAFENGNIDDVRDFISEEIEDVFDQVIEDRKSKGLVIEAEYLGTRETRLMDATFDRETGVAEISVSFSAEMTSVVLGSDGTVIEGDSKQVKRQKDIWTFARDISSNDPNWQLVATSE
jgi:predicted lipid-binding transport protein (Tim44 family)